MFCLLLNMGFCWLGSKCSRVLSRCSVGIVKVKVWFVHVQHGSGEGGADAAGRSSDTSGESAFINALWQQLDEAEWWTASFCSPQDINLKVAKSSQVLHFQFREDKQWKLQQVHKSRTSDVTVPFTSTHRLDQNTFSLPSCRTSHFLQIWGSETISVNHM